MNATENDAARRRRLHDTWFIGIITCVRASNPDRAMSVLADGGAPPFREQLAIYSSHPRLPGWQNMPAVHARARHPYDRTVASVPASRAVDREIPEVAEADGQQ